MKYLKLALIVADVAVNVFLCLIGAICTLDASMLDQSWNTTLSARAWQMDSEGKPWGRLWRPVIDGIFFWQVQHCFVQFSRERLAGGVWASLNQPSA
jgi:hypothetical protein